MEAPSPIHWAIPNLERILLSEIQAARSSMVATASHVSQSRLCSESCVLNPVGFFLRYSSSARTRGARVLREESKRVRSARVVRSLGQAGARERPFGAILHH